MATHNPKSEKTVSKYAPKLKSIFRCGQKRIFLKYFLKNCKKTPNPKQRICNQFLKTIIIIIIIIIICSCAKLQKRLPSFGLEISTDASRKAVKVHPLQINTGTNIYIPNTYLHTPTGLFLHHMQKPTVAENPTIIFAVFQVSKIPGLLLLWTAATTYSSMRQGHSFLVTHMYTIHTHTHTHTLSFFLPRVSFPKASMGSINCYTRISVT